MVKRLPVIALGLLLIGLLLAPKTTGEFRRDIDVLCCESCATPTQVKAIRWARKYGGRAGAFR